MRVNIVNVPVSIMSLYRNVTASADIMFVNRAPFLMSISEHLRFGTAQHLDNRRVPTIVKAVRAIRRVYLMRGFILSVLKMDGEFEPIRGELAGMHVLLNTTAENEHVPEVERRIRTVKERCRGVYCTLPFKKMPLLMIIALVYSANMWLNAFPAADGVSDTLSPRTIVTGRTIDYHRHCRLEFGEYVQSHESGDNTVELARTTGAIALRPTGNTQGSWRFMSLATGREITRRRWTALPMPNEVIDRVHALARRRPRGLTFLIGTANASRTPTPIEPPQLTTPTTKHMSPRHPGRRRR